MKRITIEVDDDFHKAVKAKSLDENRTIKEKLTELIKEWLRK